MKINRSALQAAAKRVAGLDAELKFLDGIQSYLTLPYGKGITEPQAARLHEIRSALIDERGKLFLSFAEDFLTP